MGGDTQVVGADLETMRRLYKDFETQAGNVRELRRSLRNSFESTVWQGAHAKQFSGAYEKFDPQLNDLASLLDEASQVVKREGNNIAAATGEPPIG